MSAGEYNDPDGIALEAGGEIFIVNRSRLVQDSVVFRDMFEIAAMDSTADQGGTPEHAIPTGDSAAAFRDFLWALRVRPAALLAFTKSANTPEKAIRLINVASLAHKYQDASMAGWALEEVHETLSKSKFALEGPVLKPLLVTLAHFDNKDINVLRITQLLRERVDRASRHTLDPIALIEACTASGFTPLLIIAYNALLIAPGPKSMQWIKDPRISATNRKQLLHGAYRLTEEWDRLLCSCPSQISSRIYQQCGAARSADLLAKLTAASSVLVDRTRGHTSSSSWGAHTSRYHDSDRESDSSSDISPWRDEVIKLIDSFPDKLESYFDLEDSDL